MGRNAGGGCAAGDPRVQCGVRYVFGDVCDAVAGAHPVIPEGRGEGDGRAKEKLKRMKVFLGEQRKRDWITRRSV